jgi:hypothetical protein
MRIIMCIGIRPFVRSRMTTSLGKPQVRAQSFVWEKAFSSLSFVICRSGRIRTVVFLTFVFNLSTFGTSALYCDAPLTWSSI